MMWINQQGDSQAESGGSGMRVPGPTPSEGVGNALRTAYLPRGHDLPREIAEMLTRLR